MTYRSAVWLVALAPWLSACGGSGNGFSGGDGVDAGGGGGGGGQHVEDATIHVKDAGAQLTQHDVGPTQTCHRKTCAEIGATCGPQGDGCGGVVSCGSCSAPETCGGGGVQNRCGAPGHDAGDGSAPIPTGPLSIAPLNAAITVPYGQQAPTLTYTAEVGGQPVAASFTIDLGQVASVNASTGLLTPSGRIGGVAHVTASFGSQTLSTPVTITVLLSGNGAPDGGVDAGNDAGSSGGNGGVGGLPAGGPVTAAMQAVLQGAPQTDMSLAWLYPYDNTVWPQGILPPLLQWTTSLTYDAVYIKLQESSFTYEGFFSTPTPGLPFVNVPIDRSAWDTLEYSNQGEPVTATLVFSANGVAYGPLTETWIIAQGTLTGTVYYNSYGTALAINYVNSTPGYPDFGGATLGIKAGATSPVLVAGTSGGVESCRVCHSVAAGGSTLVTQHGDNYEQSSAYALTAANAETVMPPLGATVATYAFPAIYPDGTLLLSNGGPLPATVPPSTSGLFSIPSGAPIAALGLPDGFVAAVPAFSPDGTHVAYNEYGVDKVSLGTMEFDVATSTFSNPVNLHTPPPTTTDLFPSFLPTNDAVIFEREVVNAGEFGATRSGARGELWWVDLATQNAVPLANLNGVGYLPSYGTNHATDETLQYEPTVNPVASGGYAWVVFTSRRLYGNVATQDPFLSDPRSYNASESVTTKKLWVAAINLNAPAGTDPSHPAFYLPAQELNACNSRGYWVVDPCAAGGTSCLTGDQCCTGYCGQGDGGFVCGVAPAGCSVLGNKCTASGDCCGAATGISCIDGFCAQPGHPDDAGGCVPTTCSALHYNCGQYDNGCGLLIDCGTCTNPQTCGGGGESGVCGGQSGPP